MNKIKVIYRKFLGGDIIALFPEIPGYRPWLCQSYQHIGQHSDASIFLVSDTLPAKPEDYKDLHEELQSIYENDPDEPCKLVICKRISRKMDEVRNKAGDWYWRNNE